MEHHTRVSMLMVRNTAGVALHGQTIALTKEISLTITSKVTAYIIGVISESIEVTGETTRWKVRVYLNGQTAEDTKASTSMIKKKARGRFTGLTVVSTKVRGSTANRTALAPIQLLVVKQKWVNGKMASAYNGYEIISF